MPRAPLGHEGHDKNNLEPRERDKVATRVGREEFTPLGPDLQRLQGKLGEIPGS